MFLDLGARGRRIKTLGRSHLHIKSETMVRYVRSCLNEKERERERKMEEKKKM